MWLRSCFSFFAWIRHVSHRVTTTLSWRFDSHASRQPRHINSHMSCGTASANIPGTSAPALWKGCSVQLSNPWQPVQPAVIIRSRLSITRWVTGCWTDEGLLQGALPGSPSSLAPQELAAVPDIQGRSPLTDFSPRERLWAPRHRARSTLASRLASPQGARVGRGSSGLLGTVTQASGVNNRSPSSGSGCLPAAFFVQKYTCNTSRRVLLAVVHPSPRLQRQKPCSPSASHACSLAGRGLSCTTGQFRSTSPPPLALRLFLCYVGLNHGQYLRPSKHNAA